MRLDNMDPFEMRPSCIGDMESLKKLWIECFADAPEYAHYIFTKLIKPAHALVCAHGMEIPAMLFFEPFTLKAGGDFYSGAYIYGVATAVKYRGMGLSTRLLAFAHEYLSKSGYALSILVPAGEGLFEFYRKRGYSVFSDLCKVKIGGAEIANMPDTDMKIKISLARLENLYDIRENYFGDSCGFVCWSREYLEYIGGECTHFGGEVLRIEYAAGIGYAVCYRDKNKITHIKEMVLPDENRFFIQALKMIHQRYGAVEYNLSLRANFQTMFTQSLLPYSMIKWYDDSGNILSGSILRAYAYIGFVLD